MPIGCFPLLWGNYVHLLSWLWQWLGMVRAPTLGHKIKLLKLLLHMEKKSLLDKHHKFKSFLDYYLNFWFFCVDENFLSTKQALHWAARLAGNFCCCFPSFPTGIKDKSRSPGDPWRDKLSICIPAGILQSLAKIQVYSWDKKIIRGDGLLLRRLTAGQPGYLQV